MRGGELDERLGTLKRRFQYLPILCVFVSLREIRFRFLGFRKGEEESFLTELTEFTELSRGDW